MLEGMTPPHNKSISCKLAQTLLTLEDSDRQILQAAVDDLKSWPASTLSNQLRLRQILLSDMTITKHRTKLCACARQVG